MYNGNNFLSYRKQKAHKVNEKSFFFVHFHMKRKLKCEYENKHSLVSFLVFHANKYDGISFQKMTFNLIL